MILEERDYTLEIDSIEEYLSTLEKDGLPIMREHLGSPLGVFLNETGDLTLITTLWRYDDLADRARRRRALWGDHRWSGYLGGIKPMLRGMRSRILSPAIHTQDPQSSLTPGE